jgi:hypothetical protein
MSLLLKITPLSFLLFLGLAACQPGLTPLADKLSTPPPASLNVTPLFLTERAPNSPSIPTSPTDAAPLSLSLDSSTDSDSLLQSYHLTLDLHAWQIKAASRVRLHLPPSAAIRQVSAAGWNCSEVTAQDELLTVGHLDLDCLSLVIGRTPQTRIIVTFSLPHAAEKLRACAEVAVKEQFEPPICVDTPSW